MPIGHVTAYILWWLLPAG